MSDHAVFDAHGDQELAGDLLSRRDRAATASETSRDDAVPDRPHVERFLAERFHSRRWFGKRGEEPVETLVFALRTGTMQSVPGESSFQ